MELTMLLHQVTTFTGFLLISHYFGIFLEAFFPSIAVHNNLKYNMPKELCYIEYRHDWTSEDINTTHLFHPVKNLTAHVDNRLLERF